jgi:urea transport system substrate-binding protein
MKLFIMALVTNIVEVVAKLPPLLIGILHSQTGTLATSEKGVIDATVFAVDEINALGYLGREIVYILEDGKSDSAVFANKSIKLITQDKVITVFGCWASADRKTIKPIYEEYDSLLMYPLQYEGLEMSPNIFCEFFNSFDRV